MTTRKLLRPVSAASAATALSGLRNAITALNLHFAGVALLGIVNLYLLIHMAFAWQTAHSQDADALAHQRIQLKLAQVASLPLQGLDSKLAASTVEANTFYDQRLPYAFSQVLAELGTLAKEENVKLNRVQYGTPKAVLDDASVHEYQMDASLNGDYRPLVEFINRLERDKLFFLISGVTLTGQQSGVVGLRLRVTTYFRAAHGSEHAEPLPSKSDAADAEAAPAQSATAPTAPTARGHRP